MRKPTKRRGKGGATEDLCTHHTKGPGRGVAPTGGVWYWEETSSPRRMTPDEFGDGPDRVSGQSLGMTKRGRAGSRPPGQFGRRETFTSRSVTRERQRDRSEPAGPDQWCSAMGHVHATMRALSSSHAARMRRAVFMQAGACAYARSQPSRPWASLLQPSFRPSVHARLCGARLFIHSVIRLCRFRHGHRRRPILFVTSRTKEYITIIAKTQKRPPPCDGRRPSFEGLNIGGGNNVPDTPPIHRPVRKFHEIPKIDACIFRARVHARWRI